MKIYDKNNLEIYDISVDDSSVRYRAIMTDDSLTLNFAHTAAVTIPRLSYVNFEGQRYTLWRPSEFKKLSTRNFEYTLVLHGWREYLKFVKYKDMSAKPYRLKFSLTAKPLAFLQDLVATLNHHDAAGGWMAGDCIDAPEKTLSFNHEFCIDALGRFAQEWQTEFEFEGKKIHLRKVEKFKSDPLPLSYGKGNGFLPGVGRYNEGDKQPSGRLFVQGGERNIDFSTYNSKSLLLPKSATLVVDGKTYRTDADGMFITRDGNTNTAEDSYDASEIYPRRVGTVSEVVVVDSEKHFYDIKDSSIPEALNYRDCRIAGEKAIIKFESGALAGREFDIEQTDTDLTGYIHAERRFKIVPAELDGHIMPGGVFVPAVGDKYAIFNISMPNAYISDSATKTGASWDMFREAVRYFTENEADRFRFTGELDGVWSKSQWLAIGGKIVPGGHVLFSDTQFQTTGVVIRIVAIKDYVNQPHKPEITLSNAPISGSFSSELAKLEADEVVIEESKKEIIRLTKRQWRDARETMEMLNASLLNFSSSINPITVQTMQLILGDESLQFRFVNSKTVPIRVNHSITFNTANKTLSAAAGILQHMSIGITTLKNKHAALEYKYWDMAAYTSPVLDASKAYYLYAKCSKTTNSGTFILSETAIAMEGVTGFYHLLVGILNSENLGERSFASLYGYTEVTPGRVVTNRIESEDGGTFFDLVNGIIGGKIRFIATGGTETNLADWADGAAQDIQDAQGAANAAALAAQQAIDDAAANVGLINTEVGKLQAQIDGEVSNWFYPYSPTLANYPASDWTTNAIKDRHIGDTFTNTQQAPATDAGKSWRFVKNGAVYSWTQIADSDAVLALQKAAQAQSTADGKSTTYLIQPTSYKLGDMWVLAADQTVNGVAYKSGEILTATQDSTTFVQAHWVKKVRYTDDTAVNNMQIGGRNLFSNFNTQIDQSGLLAYSKQVEINGFYGAGDNNNYVNYVRLSDVITSNGFYTVSFEMRGTQSAVVGLYVSIAGVKSERFLTNNLNTYNGRKYYTVEVTDYTINSHVDFHLQYAYFYVKDIKVEKGNKPTDWSPAPEDVQAAIDAAVVKATYWSVKASAPVIYKDAINAATSGAHTPVTVSGELRSGTTTTSGGFITVTPNGGAEAGTASASPVTIAPANGDGKTSYTVRLYDAAAKTTLLDTMTIPVVFKGASGVNAINVVLSNEADVLPASPEGVVSDYSGSGIIIRVFEGATELDYDGIGTVNGKFNVTASATGITAGAKSESGLTCVFANASNMTSDNATIVFTIAGKTADGASFSLTKTQSFAKSRTGQKGDTGASAPLLYLSASAQVMKCNPDNTPQAGQTITLEAKLQNVSGTATFVATPYDDAGTAQTPATLGGTGNTRTLTNSQWLAAYKRIEVVATLGSLTDKVTIYRVADGATGKGISGTEIRYQAGASGTTAPTGTWLTSVPTVPEGQFLWTRTITSYTDSTSTTSYSVSKQGVSGSDGKGISSTVITYQASSSGTVVPTGAWTETVPSVSENQYLWTRTVIIYTDSSTSTSYSVGKMGAKGDAGQNAIVGLLTNESVTLQANNAGTVSSFTPANGEFWVYNGVTKVTTGITFSKVSETGCTAAITSAGAYSVSAMSADNATVVLRAVYGGVTIDKVLTLSKSRAGADGVSITLVDVEFAKNTNPTTAPTTGWATTAPTLAEGEQLWTRTKTTYSTGNPTYSTPANITPKTGPTGTGIDSVTEEYAISTSKTTQPTTGWSTTQPAWSNGQYIWSRVKVVYKNPTQTIYTGYAVSSEWEAVNDLEIGGRNLFSNLNTVIGQSGLLAYSKRVEINGFYGGGLNNGYENHVRLSNVIKGNGYYTVSFEMRGAQSLVVGLYVSIAGIRSSTRFTTNNSNTFNGVKSYTVNVTNYSEENSHVDFHLQYAYFYIKDIKVEKGNRPTDWSPAPEDVQAAIDAEKNRINDILSDNIADPSEKQYLSNLWQEIYAEYPRIWAQANTYAVDKSNYEAKYSALNTLLSPVLANLTVNTTVSGASIRTAFSQYYDAKTFLLNNITNKVNQNAGDAAAVAGDAQAKANTAKAVTDKFSGFDGGLATAVIMEMREPSTTTRGDATAGISGIQKDINGNFLPAVWAGGTYAQAIDGLAKAIIKHNGKSKLSDTEITGVINALSGKVGVLTIEESGRVVLTDPDTHAVRLVFSESDIPLIADLVSGANDGGSASNAAQSNITVGYLLPNAITVGKNNSSIAFSASTFTVNANIANMMDYITVNVYLRKNGVNFTTIKSVQLYGPGAKSENTSITYGVDGVGTGTYDVFIEITKTNSADTVSSYISASTLSWTYTQAGIRYFQFGVNGMMAFFSDNHWYFTETGGFDLKGKTNMPGILASGTINTDGSRVANTSWGAKNSTANATGTSGTYTVPLINMSHANYQVQITPYAASRLWYVSAKTTTSFTVVITNTSGTATATKFDYTVIGNNY